MKKTLTAFNRSIFLTTVAGLAVFASVSGLACQGAYAAAWKGLSVKVYPRCEAQHLAALLPIENELFLRFESLPSLTGAPDHVEYVLLESHRLSVSADQLMLDGHVLGRLDLSQVNCRSHSAMLPVLPVAGSSAALREERGDECREQPGEIALLDDPFTLRTHFTLELSPVGWEAAPLTFATDGVSWFDSLTECVRGRGRRAGGI